MVFQFNKKINNILRHRHMPAWLLIAFALFVFLYVPFIKPPEAFPVGGLVSVPEGAPLSIIAEQFYASGVVRSPLVFKALTKISGGEENVVAGDYYFHNALSLFGVMSRVLSGHYGVDPVVVTIPEGVTIKDIGALIHKKIPDFDAEGFIRLAAHDEGYLFPDTYKFLPHVGPRQVIEEMRAVFEKKVARIEKDILTSKRSLEEVVVMASLLEKEARVFETKQIIAGILWKRFDSGMPLQVDAVFPYINGKNTFQLSIEDLREDHPYNTYTRTGLPPGAIANPGLESLHAAVTQKETPYWFYLSDKNGTMHYAQTFDGHLANKELYLR